MHPCSCWLPNALQLLNRLTLEANQESWKDFWEGTPQKCSALWHIYQTVPESSWDSAHGEIEKLDAKTDLRCTVQINEIKSLLCCLTHAHTHWQLCVLCLSPALTLPIVLSLHRCYVLSCSDPVERAGLAGGWAGGKEGPHPWKLRGDAVASNGSIYWQVENLQRCMRLNSDVHSRALFLQIPEFSSASDDMLLVDSSWYTSIYIFGWQVAPVARASVFCFRLNLLWSTIHGNVRVVITKWVCTYNILLYKKML